MVREDNNNNNNNNNDDDDDDEWEFQWLMLNWNLGMLVFVEGGKPEYLEKNPQSSDNNQQQTQLTCDINFGNRTQAT